MNASLPSRRPTAVRWLALAGWVLAAQAASAQVTLFDTENFGGRSLVASQPMGNLERQGFNDRASSAVVSGGTWEVCSDPGFGGRCVMLRPGRYASLASTGLNDRISSVRPADDVATRPPPPPVDAITLYDLERFGGRAYTTERGAPNLEREGFNDRASSAVVTGSAWEVCSDPRFGGRCVVLRPGEYPTLGQMGLNDRISSVRRVENSAPPVAAAPQATFFAEENFRGPSFTTDEPVGNFDRQGFQGRAASVHIVAGRWEVCEDPRFGGRCMFLQPGSYPSLSSMGMGDRIASVRLVADGQVGAVDPRPPMPPPGGGYGRRGGERLYQADVVAVRAVVGTPEQRCWIERQPVADASPRPNVPGAIAGAVIGGILGHQIGGGSGRDAATAVGVFGGAVAGANVNRNAPPTQEVQRCTTNPAQATPSYYDVTYNFRGVEHRVQMATPPQATVTVNEQGEPRV
jgi:uncharacterized protein YcfJ